MKSALVLPFLLDSDNGLLSAPLLDEELLPCPEQEPIFVSPPFSRRPRSGSREKRMAAQECVNHDRTRPRVSHIFLGPSRASSRTFSSNSYSGSDFCCKE